MNIETLGNITGGFVTYITITRGETVAMAIDLSTCGEEDAAVNLTGYSMKCRIDFETPLDLNTTNGGITLTDAAAGQAQLNIDSITSAAFELGSTPFDLWMVSPADAETPLLTGMFTVVANITPVP